MDMYSVQMYNVHVQWTCTVCKLVLRADVSRSAGNVWKLCVEKSWTGWNVDLANQIRVYEIIKFVIIRSVKANGRRVYSWWSCIFDWILQSSCRTKDCTSSISVWERYFCVPSNWIREIFVIFYFRWSSTCLEKKSSMIGTTW